MYGYVKKGYIIVRQFELQSHYGIHFQKGTSLNWYKTVWARKKHLARSTYELWEITQTLQ